jgi:hypothetical protein
MWMLTQLILLKTSILEVVFILHIYFFQFLRPVVAVKELTMKYVYEIVTSANNTPIDLVFFIITVDILIIHAMD